MERGLHYETYAGPSMVKVAEHLARLGEPQPNPLLSIAFTLEDADGEIHALAVVQSLPVIEPMTADPGYGYALHRLADMVRDFILDSGAPRVLAHTSYDSMKQRLLAEGATEISDPVYDWRRPEEVDQRVSERVEQQAETAPRR